MAGEFVHAVVDALAGAGLHGWQLDERRATGAQRLYRGPELVPHQDRRVVETTVSLRAYTLGPDGVGIADLRLDPLAPIPAQVALAGRLAADGRNRPWPLNPPPTEPYPDVRTADPAIGASPSAALDAVEARLRRAAASLDGAQVCSAELYATHTARTVHTSTGVGYARDSSAIDLDLAVERLPGPNIEEVHQRLADSSVDMDVDSFVARMGEQARNLVGSVRPAPGSDVPLLIHPMALATMLEAIAEATEAGRQYIGMTHFVVGDPVSSDEPAGDPLTITLDPFVEGMVRSRAATADGAIPRRGVVVADGVVRCQPCGTRIAHYLGREPNWVAGNLVVDLGSRTTDELRRAPGVVEILRFADLTVDPARLTWNSEIKLGRRLNPDGSVTWLKGGIVAGNLRENLADVLLSSERAVLNQPAAAGARALGYIGPAAALFRRGVTISA